MQFIDLLRKSNFKLLESSKIQRYHIKITVSYTLEIISLSNISIIIYTLGILILINIVYIILIIMIKFQSLYLKTMLFSYTKL